MTVISTHACRAKRLVREIRAILGGMPTFAADPRRLDAMLASWDLGDDDFLVLPEHRVAAPSMYGDFDGEPEFEALLMCKVDLPATEFAAVADHVLRLRPDYAAVIANLKRAG